ncbi:MAG: ATP-binding protein [Colwellia sp.]
MTLVKLKKSLSSFGVKLFFWFWLTTILSIMGTRFISQLMTVDTSSEVIKKTADFEDFRHLKNIAKKIKHRNLQSVTEVFQLKRKARPDSNLWLKTGKTITNARPLKPRHKEPIIKYLKNTAFDKAVTGFFSHTKVTGPLPITLNQQDYQLFISQKLRRGDLRHMVQSLPPWAPIVIALLMSFIFCWLIARSLNKPLLNIKNAAKSIGAGNLSTRVQDVDKRNDELGELAKDFNQMANKLEQNLSAQQRLLGDVSHELRSPMTRLQMALGLAQQQNTTEQARNQYLQRCELEVSRLDKMIGEVLALSRLENTLQNLTLDRFDFSSLLLNIMSDEQFIADEKSIRIVAPKPSQIMILADRNLLTSAISNIISNAVKYGPENSTITVTLSSNQQLLTLTISDTGEGVPEQSLAHLFEPFYRVSEARDRITGGTGLGLAIAKQAVIAHKGKIFANNINKKNNETNETNDSTIGLAVTILLPLS